MAQSPREIVRNALTFNHPARLPRSIWLLPWVGQNIPETQREIERRAPSDIEGAGGVYRPSPRCRGDAYELGAHTDEWGCEFINIQRGLIGEVKAPLIADWTNWQTRVQPPYETLPSDAVAACAAVNAQCAASPRFMMAGACPRPWERYQFLRGTENALCDVLESDRPEVAGLIHRIHEFYLRELEFWALTDVDGLNFMDDWGSQTQLLIPPPIWRAIFKPLYQDYCDLAKAHGKFTFMHSDGYIAEIYDDLVEIGVNALNSQVFCMDRADLARRAKGKLAFWGEIDRQQVLPATDPEIGRRAVRDYARHFFSPCGGCFLQFEAGAGANPATVSAILDEFDVVQREAGMAV